MRVTMRVIPRDDGSYDAIIDLPFHPGVVAGGGGLKIKATGGGATSKEAKATALAKAAAVAQKIADNPVMSAILPPGSDVAIKAISTLSKSAAAGRLSEAAQAFAGPAMSRVANAIGGLFD